MNLYAYVANNPLKFNDPLGLKLTPAQCAELLKQIKRKTDGLTKELKKYDPVTDAMGGFPRRWGSGRSKPDGHYEEITNLQRGIRNDLHRYERECKDEPPDPMMPTCEELATRPVPAPVMQPKIDPWVERLGVALIVISEVSRVLFPPRNLIPTP